MTRVQEWLHLARSVCLCVSLYSSDCRTVYVCDVYTSETGSILLAVRKLRMALSGRPQASPE